MKNLLFVLFLLPVITFGQQKKIIVEGSAPDYYIKHTAGPKENFYSIGRIYNISPRVFAPYNHLDMEKGLSIGQILKIPLNEINFSENGSAAEDELIYPLYTKSQGKEKLLGYLKIKKELSSLASNAIAPKKIISNTPETVAPTAAVKSPTVNNETPAVVNIPPKPEQEATTKANANPSVISENKTEATKNFKGGFFSKAFNSQIIKTNYITATGSIFKSTSGWKDEKYYCFHNIADAGSILKITNPANGKSVYAKVLDVIPDIAANQGLNVIISNSAADELGVSGDKFGCKLSY